jgi:segregation and condensation protein A
MSQADLPLIPLARIHGEPMLEMPLDLYIPPDALEVVLATFQGPLDLLLYLIRKHNLDVLDIPMAQLTQQYMSYIELMQRNRLELAAEYLLMAAVLIEIKSRMLLPRPKKIDEEGDDDPRAELMRRLLDYEQMKLAAQQLNELPQVGRDFELVQVFIEHTVAQRLPDVAVEDLRQAWLLLLARAKLSAHHTVRREELSVREQMTRILRQLRHGEFEDFANLFDLNEGLPQLIVTFIAMLELAKETLLEITQTETLGKIYVRANRSLNA